MPPNGNCVPSRPCPNLLQSESSRNIDMSQFFKGGTADSTANVLKDHGRVLFLDTFHYRELSGFFFLLPALYLPKRGNLPNCSIGSELTPRELLIYRIGSLAVWHSLGLLLLGCLAAFPQAPLNYVQVSLSISFPLRLLRVPGPGSRASYMRHASISNNREGRIGGAER